MVIEGELTLGVLAAFLGYLRRFFRPLMDLSQVYNTYQQAAAALDRINHYMELPVENSFAEETAGETDENDQVNEIQGELTFEDVYFSYQKDEHIHQSHQSQRHMKADPDATTTTTQDKHVEANDIQYILRGVSFTIPAGEAVSLVGESGAGKSTLIKLLTRMYAPDSGKILLDGVDIQKIPLHNLRSWVGVFSQDVHLFNRSIVDNIRYGDFDATQEEIEAAAKKAHIHRFITGLPQGYDSIVGQEGIKLSGGQKQLIALARLFLKDPKVLVLDEPTSNVDVHTEALVVQALQNLMQGKTVLVISHRESTVSFTDKRLELVGGEVK